MSEVKCPICGAPLLLVGPETPAMPTIVRVSDAFPERLRSLLDFSDETDFIKIKPKRWLKNGVEFREVALIAKDLGGEYIRGKGHFRVPKDKTPGQATF